MKNRRLGLGLGGLLVVVGLAGAGFMFMRMRHLGASQEPPGGLKAVTRQGQAVPADPAASWPENTAAQTVGPYQVALALAPYPPVSFSAADFDVTLTDAAGAAVTDAAITLDLTMPGMWMPVNRPAAEHAGAGLYHAPGRFTMRGEWWIEVIIERGGEKHSAFFSVWL